MLLTLTLALALAVPVALPAQWQATGGGHQTHGHASGAAGHDHAGAPRAGPRLAPRSTSPAAGAALHGPPARFTADFARPVVLTSLILTSEGREPMPIRVSSHRGALVSAPLPSMSRGAHTLTWRVSDAAGQSATGSIVFVVH